MRYKTAMAVMTSVEMIHDSVGSENIRMMQLAKPRHGIRGNSGALNVFRSGFFFLSLIAEECRIMWVVSIEKLVIAAVCLKSEKRASAAIIAPVTRMDK